MFYFLFLASLFFFYLLSSTFSFIFYLSLLYLFMTLNPSALIAFRL